MITIVYVIIFLSALFLCNIGTSEALWGDFIRKYRRHHGTDNSNRRSYYDYVSRQIEKNQENSNATFVMAHNNFSDFSDQEKWNLLGLVQGFETDVQSCEISSPPSSVVKIPNNFIPPENFNLTDEEIQCFSPVQYQGSCNSSWAVAATTAFEYNYCINNNKILVEFSVQHLIDCDATDDGCRGGNFCKALNYIYVNGFRPHDDYQACIVTNVNKTKCCSSLVSLKANISSVEVYPNRLESGISHHRSVFLVSMSVDENLYNYQSGVYNSDMCNQKIIPVNHAVVLVGYGITQSKTPYWIVRNSWGPQWGEGGYFNILRGNNTCNIEQNPFLVLTQ